MAQRTMQQIISDEKLFSLTREQLKSKLNTNARMGDYRNRLDKVALVFRVARKIWEQEQEECNVN